MVKCIVQFFLLFTVVTQLNSLIIIVHGSFAQEKSWHQPGGDFYESMKAHHPNEKIISFRWSGIPFAKEITKGAQKLAYFIATYPCKKDPITLIGHSHGGNVVMKASQLLAASVALATTLPVNTTTYFDLVMTGRMRAIALSNHEQVLPTVERAYILGTPIDTLCFMPSMDIIKQLCSLYSQQDFIQKVFGLYQRKVPQHAHCTNLKTIINNKQPGHSNLHHPIIGKWLLEVPDGINCSEWSVITWGQDGEVYFYNDHPPLCFITKNKMRLANQS